MAKSNCITSLRQVATSILLPVAFLTQAVHLAWAQIDCDGEFFSIGTQEDADKLSSCSYFPGAVSISSPTLSLVGSHFIVSNLKQLKSIRFPKLEKVADGFRIETVPELVETDFGALVEIGGYFDIWGASKLETFPIDGDGSRRILTSTDARVSVTSSGLRTLGTFFQGSMVDQVLFSNLPNLHEMTLGIVKANEVVIEGNGNLTMYMNRTFARGEIDSLTVTGVRAIQPCDWPWVTELVIMGNPIEHLRFDPIKLTKLTVQNNPQLESLWPTRSRALAELTDITITDNPLLKLSTTSTGPDPLSEMRQKCSISDDRDEQADMWLWGYEDMKVINISADIDGDFFDRLLNRWSEKGGPRVSLVDITSTNPSFNCTVFDEVRRKKGAITGHYTCQNQTAPYGSAASRPSQVWLAVAFFAVTLAALHL